LTAPPDLRIGQGIDVHPFAEGEGGLVLGGVRIAQAPALAGHSDGDALLHALVDALLGAAALGDIGSVFGTSDPRYAGVPSATFVQEARRRVQHAGWALVNVDATVVAQRPRLAPHRGAMVASLARLLHVPEGAVSVKATTTDGLGFAGRGEGVACLVVVLLHGAAGTAAG
jgi:2-C-methyl-D-erythritol 2,4-cyclodiphosphate synthase